MRLFRVAPENFARDTSGEGAKLYGARWNPKGIPVLYTAATRSLAVLESLVHASANEGPISRMLITFELPDTVASTQIRPEELPPGWNGNHRTRRDSTGRSSLPLNTRRVCASVANVG